MIGSQMVVRLSALRAGRLYSPGRFLVLISVRGWDDASATVQLEGLGKLRTRKIVLSMQQKLCD
jgi:hypothetical protein